MSSRDLLYNIVSIVNILYYAFKKCVKRTDIMLSALTTTIMIIIIEVVANEWLMAKKEMSSTWKVNETDGTIYRTRREIKVCSYTDDVI